MVAFNHWFRFLLADFIFFITALFSYQMFLYYIWELIRLFSVDIGFFVMLWQAVAL